MFHRLLLLIFILLVVLIKASGAVNRTQTFIVNGQIHSIRLVNYYGYGYDCGYGSSYGGFRTRNYVSHHLRNGSVLCSCGRRHQVSATCWRKKYKSYYRNRRQNLYDGRRREFKEYYGIELSSSLVNVFK